jgi:hypothetical protein
MKDNNGTSPSVDGRDWGLTLPTRNPTGAKMPLLKKLALTHFLGTLPCSNSNFAARIQKP